MIFGLKLLAGDCMYVIGNCVYVIGDCITMTTVLNMVCYLYMQFLIRFFSTKIIDNSLISLWRLLTYTCQPFCKAQMKGPDEEVNQRKDEKTTSQNGSVWA